MQRPLAPTALLALLALVLVVGCLARPDPVWNTGNCGVQVSWAHPGAYDEAPREVASPAKHRTQAPSLPPLLPFDEARPLVLTRMTWNVDASIVLERARSDGSLVLSVPTGGFPPEPEEIDAMLAIVSQAPADDRARWRDALLDNPTQVSWWTRLPDVDLEGVPARLDALAPREVSRAGASVGWSWSLAAQEEGRRASVIMELHDERPTLQYAWPEGQPFLVSIAPGDVVDLRADRPLPSPDEVAAAFARMELPAPPVDRWPAPTNPTVMPTPTGSPWVSSARCVRV